MTHMLKSTWKNFIENWLSSPLIKHQTILHLYVENITFLNYLQKFLQVKKIQHEHIYKRKSPRRKYRH